VFENALGYLLCFEFFSIACVVARHEKVESASENKRKKKRRQKMAAKK
jgi:hypothetical protein